MTFSITVRQISSWVISGACWVEMTTVCTRTGLCPSYSTVTWLLPSGRSQGISPDRRAAARCRVRRCASAIGSGISSGVSRHAKPNISPWSPAPPVSTPWAISGDCGSMADSTAQVSLSKPYSVFV